MVEEDDKSVFEKWIDNKYKQFTLIGVFGGLSVYLTQIPGEVSKPIQAGIAGSLIIFFLLTTMLVFDGIKKALGCINDSSIHIFTFMFVSASLIGIIISVVSILFRYSKGASPLVDAALTVSVCLYYFGFVFVDKPFTVEEPENIFHQVMSWSPHIALIWMGASIVYLYNRGKPTLLHDISDPFTQEVLIQVLTHLVLTLLILFSLIIGDVVVHRLPNALQSMKQKIGYF